MLLIWLIAAIGVTGAAFTPGCSFANGQCSYTVQLGHLGQCDKPAATTAATNTDCCTGLQHQITDLQNLVNTIVDDVKALQKGTTTTINQTGSTAVYNDLLTQLEAKEAELNKTKLDSAAQLQHALADVHSLREQLTNKTRELNSCKGVLGLQTSNTTITTTTNDNVNMTYCDFQSDRNCGFRTNSWKIHSGSASVDTGPIEDHTYGSPHGKYFYMDAMNNLPTHNTHSSSASHSSEVLHTFEMESAVFEPSPAACVRFWYNMNGKDIRDLKVYAKIGSGKGYPVWTKTGQQGQSWHLAEVNLDSEYTASPFQIVVEGSTDSYNSGYPYHRDYNTWGDIAVDDLYVYNASCKSIPSCPSGSIQVVYDNSTSCYAFHTTLTDWYDAAYACRSEGAQSALVSVNSKEEQESLVNHIKGDSTLMTVSSYGFYTSGNDEREEGHFDWTDSGTPYQSTYTDWHTGQPNNVASNQNCLMLQYADSNLEWGDIDCSSKHAYICETTLPTAN